MANPLPAAADNPLADASFADVASVPSQTGAPVVRTSHPIGFWFFIWGEFAERCSFYGMKAILLLYMIDRLGFDKGVASGAMNYFKAACYFLPLLGGFLADNYFGKYRTIVAFSLPYILGHVIIGFENVPCLLISLALLAMGAGVIKPNVSTLMGITYEQQRPGQAQLQSDAFGMFYVAINTGSFVSSFAMPLIRNAYGYRIAFLFPAAMMIFAFALFAAGKPFYGRETVHRVHLTRQERRERWIVLRRIFGLFAVVVFFWSVLEQYDNTWILFARDHIDLNVCDFAPGTWQASLLTFAGDHLGVNLLDLHLVADQFQVLNPIFVMVLVPIVAIVWRRLARAGFHLRPTDKMAIGFVFALAAPLLLAIAGARAGEAGRVSAWWLFSAYFVVTLAEVCISVVGLELAFTAAPNSMKSFVTACWLLTMSAGDFVNALVTPHYDKSISVGGLTIQLSPPLYFGLYTLMMVPVMVAFVFVARRFNVTDGPRSTPPVPVAPRDASALPSGRRTALSEFVDKNGRTPLVAAVGCGRGGLRLRLFDCASKECHDWPIFSACDYLGRVVLNIFTLISELACPSTVSELTGGMVNPLFVAVQDNLLVIIFRFTVVARGVAILCGNDRERFKPDIEWRT